VGRLLPEVPGRRRLFFHAILRIPPNLYVLFFTAATSIS
jgi:hypothetical protein